MANYSISFKIKDYNPKKDFFSYKDYICILINGDFQIRIPIISDEYSNIKHELKNLKSNLYYKIALIDNKTKNLISIGDYVIPYKLLLKIIPDNPFMYEKEIKFSIEMKTQLKIFDSLNKIENIFLVISSKILKKQKKTMSKNKSQLFNNYLSKGIKEHSSFTQRIEKRGNLLKNKVGIKKQRLSKDKDDFFLSDSNRHISTNDLSGNHFNTFSINDDTENNTNNNLNINSSIANITSHKYYYFNTTSGKDESKNNNINDNKNNNYNVLEYKIKNIINDNNGINEISELLEKKNNIKKKIFFNKDISMNNKISQNNKKNVIKNIKINKIKYKKNIYKYKTRNSFNSNKRYKNENYLGNEEERGNSMRCTKKKIIKLTNEDSYNFNSCESFNNKNYLSTDSKKIKSNLITKTSFHKCKIDKNKIISLSKSKYDKLLINKKKKFISENIINKALLSERLSRSQNVYDKSNSGSHYSKKKKIYNKNIKTKENKKIKLNNKNNIKSVSSKIINNINKEKEITISSPNLNKAFNASYNKLHINNLPDSKIEITNEKIYKNLSNNSTRIKVNKSIKKIKSKNYNQVELKNYTIKLSDYFILNNKNIKSIYLKFKEKIKKLNLSKELFFSLLKKSNRLEEKKSLTSINHYATNIIKNILNERIMQPLIKIKNKEFTIYQKIFNITCMGEEVQKYKEEESIFHEKLMNLQLSLIKNMIDHYGNISQIYTDDEIKKEILKNILLKNNIIEKENKNNIIDLVSLNKINTSVKKIIKNTFNNDVNYQFNIIKEVLEEKESEKNSISKSNNNTSNAISISKNSLMNDITDEILFIDKKETDNEDDLNNKIKRINRNNINKKEDLINNKSIDDKDNNSSKSLDKIINEDEKDNKKNIRKEIIGMNKRKFKGKNLNFDEFDIDFNINRRSKKVNLIKIGYFNKRKKG